MNEPLHVAILETLAMRLERRREKLKERMAAGLPQREYDVSVGEAKALKYTGEEIAALIKQSRDEGFDPEDIEDDERTTSRRPAPQRRGQRAR